MHADFEKPGSSLHQNPKLNAGSPARGRRDPRGLACRARRGLAILAGACALSPQLALAEVVPNDPDYPFQWGLVNHDFPNADIEAPQAWEKSKGRSDVVIAILDQGVQLAHPDLLISGSRMHAWGRDYTCANCNATSDSDGHGTGVAGIIGALTDNNRSVAGILWNLSFIAYRLGTNAPPEDNYHVNVASAITDARDKGADIIVIDEAWDDANANNCGPIVQLDQGSIRIPLWCSVSTAERDAWRMGKLLIAPAGDVANNVSEYKFPGTSPFVLTVGAIDYQGNLWSSSNTGGWIDLVAPGVAIGTLASPDGIQSLTGTKTATAFVAGVAGLVIAKGRDRALGLSSDDVRHLLEITAKDMEAPGWDARTGWGLIDPDSALTLLTPAYSIAMGATIGGAATLVAPQHKQTFKGEIPNLAAGTYFGVETWKVTSHVSFATPYVETPTVWVREHQSTGWYPTNPVGDLPFGAVQNPTTSGFDLATYVYFVRWDVAGRAIMRWLPSTREAASVAYTSVAKNPTITDASALPGTFTVETRRNATGPGTTFRIGLPRPGRLVADLFTVAGRRQSRLADAYFEAGTHELGWPGTSLQGAHLPHGMYLYKIRFESEVRSGKLVLLQ